MVAGIKRERNEKFNVGGAAKVDKQRREALNLVNESWRGKKLTSQINHESQRALSGVETKTIHKSTNARVKLCSSAGGEATERSAQSAISFAGSRRPAIVCRLCGF
jgi:hypothetical protein